MPTITRVKDVLEFLKWAAEVRQDFDFEEDDPMTPWFRGQDAGWNLCPTLYRPEYDPDSGLQVEHQIREEFVARAPTLCEGISAPDTDWGWYFLMRHFGAPTRLLDWTEFPLLALYFAVKDNDGLKDAVVWALDPYQLNENVFKGLKIKVWRGGEVICPIPGVGTARERERVKRWLPETSSRARGLPRWPIAVYPMHIAQRISTQRSNFTIHGRDTRGLNEMGPRVKRCLLNIRIPSTQSRSIRKELERNGIDESMAYPDLGGLGRSLCLKWRSDSHDLPHDGVYTRLRPSPIHGIGVFAIRPIKKGMRLFLGDSEKMLWVDEKHAPKRPRAIRELYSDFAVKTEGHYGCPTNFNWLTMSWYINEPTEGDSPNVRGDPETHDFWALRDIASGEELTAKYGAYSERSKNGSEKTGKANKKKRV